MKNEVGIPRIPSRQAIVGPENGFDDSLFTWVKEVVARRGILAEIVQERIRQDAKWGIQNHTPEKWYTILGEEFGEVGRALCEGNFDPAKKGNYHEEMVQLAAVCLEVLECWERIGEGREDAGKAGV